MKSTSPVGFQELHSARLRLDVRARTVTWTVGKTTNDYRSQSPGYLGFIAYLVAARLDGSASGYRTDADIMAEAPGWTRVTKLPSVGTKVWKIVTALRDRGLSIIDCPNGPTSSPWRISVGSEQIEIVDHEALHVLLSERSELHQALEPCAPGPPVFDGEPTPEALAAVEDLIERGSGGGCWVSIAEEAMDRAARSRDPRVRADSQRVRAMWFRRMGRLGEAEKRAQEALDYFVDRDTADARICAAACLNELGAVAYRRGAHALANERFKQELAVLQGLDGQRAACGRSRALYCLALAAWRTDDVDRGIGWAREARAAAEAVGDEVGRWIARAVELRLTVHRGPHERSSHALRRLEEASQLVPATAPAAVILTRRLLLEALLVFGDEQRADRLALAIIRDAGTMGSARDVDGVVRLLKLYGRPLLQELPRSLAATSHDQLQDHKHVDRTYGATGRLIRWDGEEESSGGTASQTAKVPRPSTDGPHDSRTGADDGVPRG